MKITLFDKATGKFVRVLGLPEKAIAANVPDGLDFKAGHFDRESQRIDIKTGEVVDYQPPQPSPDHEWRENVVNGRPRWIKKPEIAQSESEEQRAKRFIEDLELAYRVMESGRLSASERATLQRFASSPESSEPTLPEPAQPPPE